MSYFSCLMNEVEFGRHNIEGINYKQKVICLINESPQFTSKKVDLARGLSSINSDKPHPYFMNHNTVFDVLSNRLGLIEKIGDSYRFKQSLTRSQQQEIKDACHKGLRGLKL